MAPTEVSRAALSESLWLAAPAACERRAAHGAHSQAQASPAVGGSHQRSAGPGGYPCPAGGSVLFSRLGLVVVDEQHVSSTRGIDCSTRIAALLTMTATPIPEPWRCRCTGIWMSVRSMSCPCGRTPTRTMSASPARSGLGVDSLQADQVSGPMWCCR